MLLNELPVEIQIKIYSNLDINSIYNLLLTRKDINLLVKTHFIKKEKWAILNEFQDLNDIIKLINSGYRYISLNKRIQLICNYSLKFLQNFCEILEDFSEICKIHKKLPMLMNFLQILRIRAKPQLGYDTHPVASI